MTVKKRRLFGSVGLDGAVFQLRFLFMFNFNTLIPLIQEESSAGTYSSIDLPHVHEMTDINSRILIVRRNVSSQPAGV